MRAIIAILVAYFTAIVSVAAGLLYFAPTGVCLYCLSGLLATTACFFLAKGDIVCQDPEWSLSLKRCFCAVLFTASLALFLLAGSPSSIAPFNAKDRLAQNHRIETANGDSDREKAVPVAVISPSLSTVATNDPPAQLRVDERAPSPSSESLQFPAVGVTLLRKVFGRFGNATKPLESAFIRAGQVEAYTDNSGGYRLWFPKTPRNDLLIMISHADCLPRFRRLDELQADAETVLDPKLRVAVFDFSFPNNPGFEELQNALRKNLEKELVNTGHIKVVLHDEDREKVLRVLRKQYEDRGIYEKDTLIQVGHMCAASHGIYGSINLEGPNYRVSCTLANLASGTTEKEQVVIVKGQKGWNDFAGSLLGIRTLAQLSRVRIVTPPENSIHERVIKAEGFALMRPREWSLWLTLVPSGSSLHFPQQRLTVESDESWKSSQVNLGTEAEAREPLRFTMFALFADPDYSEQISTYLREGTNKGLDINSWDPTRYCIGHSIELTRQDGRSRN